MVHRRIDTNLSLLASELQFFLRYIEGGRGKGGRGGEGCKRREGDQYICMEGRNILVGDMH